jgi:hypothetical protein
MFQQRRPTSRLRGWRAAQRRPAPARVAVRVLLALEGTLALSTGYLLALLAAARGGAGEVLPRGGSGGEAPARAVVPEHAEQLRMVVLVPAHDEQAGIGATLDSLRACAYPPSALRVVVIADNCTDGTAACARAAGAQVWERAQPERRGKGFALAWALDRLDAEGDTFDALVVLDADCLASPNMLAEIDRRLRRGTRALQVNYVVANPHASRCDGAPSR